MLWLKGAGFILFSEHGLTQRALEAQRTQIFSFHVTSNSLYDIYVPLPHDVVTDGWLLASYSS